MVTDVPARSALDGLRVVDLSQTLPGALAGQLLADFGAEVVLVEPSGGSRLRRHPAFPFWARGRRSAVVDLNDPGDRDVVCTLAARADVLLETWRPGVAERLGLGYDDLAAVNPQLVVTSITGFPATGPYRDVQGYEGLVMARAGALGQFGPLTRRAGPAYVATPYASYGAAHNAVQGTLAALHERDRSGRGQHVRASLLQGLAGQSTYNWMLRFLTAQYPGAFDPTPPYDEDGVPTFGLVFRLAVALTADGRWLQFSQTQPRLFDAMMRVLGLDWMQGHPDWPDLPNLPTAELRDAFWTVLLEAIGRRTATEWAAVFDAEPDVWAEVFRSGTELLDHPQMAHDGSVLVLDDPRLGPVRQPAPIVRMAGTPARPARSAPALDEYGPEARSLAGPPARSAADPGTPRPPLAGVTVLEIGTFFAAPYGSCVLADLGARVVKIEPITGEPLRHMLAFPEAGAVKVLQGKESVALDLRHPDGLAVAHQLARRADIVLQTFRGGVAERLGVDELTLRGLNPDLVYLAAPGYGGDGPCGHRPAFAPTIGAGSGMGRRNVGPHVAERPGLDIREVKLAARQLAAGVSTECAQADGVAALAVATAMLLGLVARDRGAGGQAMATSMLLSNAYLLSEDMVEYAGRTPIVVPDPELFGLGALYRLYRAADGWIFLAAPAEKEWLRLVSALGSDGAALADDPRFASARARQEHDDALAAELATIFGGESAESWEHQLLAADVGCVRADEGPVEAPLQSAEFGGASGMLAMVTDPTFGEIPRLTPLASLSRTPGVVGPAPSLGQHTDAVLAEVGHTPEQIADLRARGVVA
jgi:crotonobetainyl-CoA:carnitine CoA-transferase CaiB-like acyl-CoA transferase